MNKFCIRVVLIILIGLVENMVFINAQTIAIQKAEALINNFVTTPEEMRDKAWEQAKENWDSVELIDRKELSDGRIEYTLKYSVDQKTRIYTTEQKNVMKGPQNVIVDILGPISGPNEDFSAYDATNLIAKCKEWYITDENYHKIIDILEKEVVVKLKYDWKDFLGIEKHAYEQALQLGVGICDVYASQVSKVLTKPKCCIIL